MFSMFDKCTSGKPEMRLPLLSSMQRDTWNPADSPTIIPPAKPVPVTDTVKRRFQEYARERHITRIRPVQKWEHPMSRLKEVLQNPHLQRLKKPGTKIELKPFSFACPRLFPKSSGIFQQPPIQIGGSKPS